MAEAPPRHGGNVEQLARQLNCHPRRILDFSASLVPFGPPRSLRRALRQALNDHVVPYPDPSYQALREAIARMHGLDPGWILPGNGAAELFTWAARDAQSFINLLPTPGFADYQRALTTWGAVSRSLPLRLHWGDGPQSWVEALADPSALQRLDPPRHTALWITNPHNPTGQLWRRDSLEPLLHAHGLLVVDEAFLPLVPGGEKHSLIPLAPRFGNLVVIRSLTKLFAMAGLRLGYAVAAPARLERWSRWRDPWPVNGLAVRGGLAVLADSLWQQRVWRWLAREGPWLTQRLGRQCPSLQVYPGAANYRLLSCNHSLTPLQQSLARQGILVRDCRSFLGLGDHWLRIAVGKRPRNRRLAAAMAAALKRLGHHPPVTPRA
ncbi:MAG: threonine-phosphate decarboxylase [Synechococcus sp. SB0662_bin_45]|nr:threonine-phosphate decarboxylase [Synechococcus sp. SB0668_bin_13]MYE21638.1 threonine-phosphate decarboxylase [Synechococcus sp. SB0662_bin_45]